jgi:hypothetical protein
MAAFLARFGGQGSQVSGNKDLRVTPSAGDHSQRFAHVCNQFTTTPSSDKLRKRILMVSITI